MKPMEKPLTIEEKQEVLLNILKESEPGKAFFGVEKDVVNPLIKKGIIHKDTFKYTGGATLTLEGREFVKTLPPKKY